ncbi:amino acid adenylation domain-containing protein [Micromonospora orduensis]|uniref:Amino acid adenylation domain-containing protein n=2 Tax=Micromonospora orduensis TaxID=1420891 RepID=A0A5C4QDW2_9ACTN|nr:amino acid adenylation domain-containing protein [Micromonospora orduensis]
MPVVRATVGRDRRVRFAATLGGDDGTTAADLCRQLEKAERSGARDGGTRISVLPLLEPEEEAAVTALNGTGRSAEAARSLPDLVGDQVRLRPHAPAVVCGTDTLSYRDLDDRSDRMAAALCVRGVRPGDVVGIAHQRSADLVVMLLAVLKAGAAYLAVEAGDPPSRCAQLLRLAGARLAVVEKDRRDQVEDAVVVVEAGELTDAASGRLPAFDRPLVTPDHLAYVSCTSGSTGEPKAVGVPHRAVARLLRGPDWVEIGPDDVILQLAPVAFDASTIEIWGPLLNGARLAVLAGDAGDFERLAREITAQGVTVLLLTTGLFNQMVGSHLDCFRTVRHVLSGGDVASPGHVARLLDAYPDVTFTNGYGPTENTSYTTCWSVRGRLEDGVVPIGTPINGTRIAVLDAALRPVPVGVCGELYASGPGLARGFIGRPGATAERFVADPSGEPGARMYRTGDLVRRRSDGVLEFVGRADQQVKIRGFRVEIGHVEAVLSAMPGVRAGVIVPQEDGVGGKRLLAYVVADGDPSAPDPTERGSRLLAALRQVLPPYMVPWAVLAYPDLPLNRNGKLDRRALPAVHRLPRALSTTFVAPRTALERRLAELWGDVLGVEPVGVEDDFFGLGGYSLVAARLLATVQRELGITVPAAALYRKPTITGMIEEIGDSGQR